MISLLSKYLQMGLYYLQTGEMVWSSGTRPLPDDTTYSTPIVGVLGGQTSMVFGSGDGSLWAFQPRTGVPIFTIDARFSASASASKCAVEPALLIGMLVVSPRAKAFL